MVGKTRSFPRLFGYLGRDSRLRAVAEALREPRTAEEFLARMADERGLGSRSLWFLVYSGLVSFAEPHPATSDAKKSRAASKRTTAAKSKVKAKAKKEEPAKTSKEELAKAAKFFEEGQGLYGKGRYAEAIMSYKAAHSIAPHPSAAAAPRPA